MKSPTAKQLAAVLIVALCLRLGAGWVWQARLDGRFGFGDSRSYWVLAHSIAHGGPYKCGEARAFRTPGYPLLLAPVVLVAGEESSPMQPARAQVMWARAQSALFGTLSVAGVWWLGRQLFDARTGLAAALIAAIYPGAIAMGTFVLSEAPFCPLMLAHLVLWTAAWKAPSAKKTILLSISAGLVAGGAALVRPSWLLFTPFAVVVGLTAGKGRLRHLAIGATMLAGLVVAMMPWWIRNARLTGHFVPTTLQVGASLYDGLSPHATGASNMDVVDQEAARFVKSQPARFDNGTSEPVAAAEYRLDGHLRSESLAWARANPGRVLQLMGIKLARLWNVWPNEAAFSAWYIRLAVLASYGPVMVLAAIGGWRTIHRGWPYVLCWLPAVYFTLLHVVFVSSIRYRQPAMLALIVLATGVVASRSEGTDKS